MSFPEAMLEPRMFYPKTPLCKPRCILSSQGRAERRGGASSPTEGPTFLWWGASGARAMSSWASPMSSHLPGSPYGHS